MTREESKASGAVNEAEADRDQKKGELVNIKVNEQLFQVPSGIYPVPRLKAMVGVPPQDNLEQLINGVVTPLDDHGKVEIRGDESFVSFPCSGGAS